MSRKQKLEEALNEAFNAYIADVSLEEALDRAYEHAFVVDSAIEGLRSDISAAAEKLEDDCE